MSFTTYIPFSDIEVEVYYTIIGVDNVIYSSAYVDGYELPADHLYFKDQHGNMTKLSDYFNFKLQDNASRCMEAAE